MHISNGALLACKKVIRPVLNKLNNGFYSTINISIKKYIFHVCDAI